VATRRGRQDVPESGRWARGVRGKMRRRVNLVICFQGGSRLVWRESRQTRGWWARGAEHGGGCPSGPLFDPHSIKHNTLITSGRKMRKEPGRTTWDGEWDGPFHTNWGDP
jgi:hypothetical protein